MAISIAALWTGNIYGTNTGKLFIRLEGDDTSLRAAVHLNDDNRGIIVIEATGSFEDECLSLSGHMPDDPQQSVDLIAKLNPNGNFRGGWTTNFGAAGTLALFPDDVFSEDAPQDRGPAQLYTARHFFGPIVIDRQELTAIANEMQSAFPSSKLVVTISTETEQIFYLDKLAEKHFPARRALMVKLHVQEPDRDGLNRLISLELGPSYNVAMTQGTDETWVIGRLEKLKNLATPFTRGFFYKFKSIGVSFNQIALLCAVVFLPSLNGLLERSILMGGVILIAFAVKKGQDRIFQNAVIYLGERSPSLLERAGPPVFSLAVAVLGGAAATLLAVWLQKWFG
ncbi:MAG: hypothetical protein U1E40_00105 [Amaricoccus sp.]